MDASASRARWLNEAILAFGNRDWADVLRRWRHAHLLREDTVPDYVTSREALDAADSWLRRGVETGILECSHEDSAIGPPSRRLIEPIQAPGLVLEFNEWGPGRGNFGLRYLDFAYSRVSVRRVGTMPFRVAVAAFASDDGFEALSQYGGLALSRPDIVAQVAAGDFGAFNNPDETSWAPFLNDPPNWFHQVLTEWAASVERARASLIAWLAAGDLVATGRKHGPAGLLGARERLAPEAWPEGRWHPEGRLEYRGDSFTCITVAPPCESGQEHQAIVTRLPSRPREYDYSVFYAELARITRDPTLRMCVAGKPLSPRQHMFKFATANMKSSITGKSPSLRWVAARMADAQGFGAKAKSRRRYAPLRTK